MTNSEGLIEFYPRLHALHDTIVDTANRIIRLADLPGEGYLWWLSDTPTVFMEARHIRRMAAERWAGFPMSVELQAAMAVLEDEIQRLPERAIISYQRQFAGIDKPPEYSEVLNKLAELWDVDEADGYDADAIVFLDIEEPPRRPQGFITHDPAPLTAAEWAAMQEASRRQYTEVFAGDIEYLMSDAETIAELSPGLPIVEAVHELRAALATALIAVQAQVAKDKNTPAG